MEAYLDNAATTKCSEGVRDIVVKTMMEDYGNPSSQHLKGLEAEKYIKTARETLAKLLKVNDKEIFFTSGGTESNNWALIGAALANRRMGNHIITTQIEHSAVANPVSYLEEEGFRVTRIGTDEQGIIDLSALQEALCEETILVSVMYVNNEIGTVQPIEQIGRLIKAYNQKILFHVDGIQAFGKYRIYPKRLEIDLLSISAHKIHGPKGSGLLYVNEKAKIKPLILGGGQQKGMRSGTDNVPGAAGLCIAAQEAYEDFERKIEYLYNLKEHFIAGVSELADIRLNGQNSREGAPHIVNVSFAGIRSEVLLHALEDRGIYVSAGSACTSNKIQKGSRTLQAIGIPKEFADGSLRFSFCEQTTIEELDYSLSELSKLLPQLRKYARK